MFLEVGYGIGIIGVLWFAVDSSRIPSIVWFWSGYSRAGWWTAVLACFVALGIPAFIAALGVALRRRPQGLASRGR